MKVTFLELYNEEVTDLLAQEDSSRSSSEDKQKKHVSLMEDGKGCVVLRGLEEEVVYSANDIYALLERGSSKRRTADTLLNKSLLTLGRVINALVEHSSHIPYMDSELTRLLRDSLGRKTETCIIATISPSAHSLEETLSTLDYAYRAKNIKNKPEANQKLSKPVLLIYLYLELERMKEGLHKLLSNVYHQMS
uniref:Kinesin motor domain-containing protein n=1 Tax=Brassica campestris TaxID=3711 RepID=M4DZM5_BRACM